MGIKKLSKFLISHNIVDRYVSFDDFVLNNKDKVNSKYIKICVDASLYVYKYNHSYNDIIFGFLNQILRMLSSNIMPIYVFDGKPPIEKNNVLKLRVERKNRLNNRIKDIESQLNIIDTSSMKEELKMIETINIMEKDIEEVKKNLTNQMEKLKKQASTINRNDMDNLKKLLDIIGLPYICAKGEADIVCAELTKRELVYTCLSDDMDLLAYGCKKILRLIDGVLYEYNLDKILSRLQLNYEQFVEMCIIIGCDYIKSLKINPEVAYGYIKRFRYIKYFEPNIINTEIEEIDNVKNIFINNIYYDYEFKNNDNIYIDFDKVILFLSNNNYNTSIEYLKKYRYKINNINRNIISPRMINSIKSNNVKALRVY